MSTKPRGEDRKQFNSVRNIVLKKIVCILSFRKVTGDITELGKKNILEPYRFHTSLPLHEFTNVKNLKGLVGKGFKKEKTRNS